MVKIGSPRPTRKYRSMSKSAGPLLAGIYDCSMCYNTVTAEDSARLFLRHVWKLHRLPDAVISDRGPQFIADFTQELYKLLGIKRSTFTTYHPQSDGQTEHVNQEMEQFLRVFINEQQNNWEELLPLAEFAYNNHSHLVF